MYHKLGEQGATSLLAGLAVLMVPIHFILGRYGKALKERSTWERIVERVGDDESRQEGIAKDEPLIVSIDSEMIGFMGQRVDSIVQAF